MNVRGGGLGFQDEGVDVDEGRAERYMIAPWQLSSSLAALFHYSCKPLKIRHFILVMQKLAESWNSFCG